MAHASVSDEQIHVLIVTDRLSSGESLAIALDGHSDLESVGVAEPAAAALSVARTHPDVVVIDAASQLDGIVDVPVIAEDHPDTRIVLVVDPWLIDHLQAFVECVNGLLSVSSPLADLIAAIRAAASDESFIDPTLVEHIVVKLGDRARAPARSPRDLLSSREQDVVAGLAEGSSPSDIAGQLGLSTLTVRGHIRNLLKKLGVHTQLQAVVVAQRLGLLDKR